MPSIGKTGQSAFPRLTCRTCWGHAKIDENDPEQKSSTVQYRNTQHSPFKGCARLWPPAPESIRSATSLRLTHFNFDAGGVSCDCRKPVLSNRLLGKSLSSRELRRRFDREDRNPVFSAT